jgi:hypothetical protein
MKLSFRPLPPLKVNQMSAQSLAKLQQAMKNVSDGWQLEFEGHLFTTKFYVNVNRSRDRFILFCNGKRIGCMDCVIPFSVFKPTYEVFNLDYSIQDKEKHAEDGCEWIEEPYQDETGPVCYYPSFKDPEKMAKFAIKHFDFLINENSN